MLLADMFAQFAKLADCDLEPRASSVIYRGPSLIDGAPIVVVAVVRSTNTKTDNMVQTYIIRADMHPLEAVRVGADSAICGGCVHKGEHDENGILIKGTRTCYVNLGHGPSSVWGALQRGTYRDVSSDLEAVRALGYGRLVRLGTYGDPAAVPVHVWRALLEDAIGHTGYSHQWRSERLGAPLRGLVMASCDNAQDRERARARGWDTFTVSPMGERIEGANLCPASSEAGKLATCSQCLRCNGARAADVYIPAHGAMGSRYTGRRILPTL